MLSNIFRKCCFRRVATCTQSTQLLTHCHSREIYDVTICNKILIQCTVRSTASLKQPAILINLISDDGCDCSISWHYSVNATEQPNNIGRFFQTLTEKSIAIQNMRVQWYDRVVKDDNGSKVLVDLRNRNTFVKYCIMVLINVFMSVWYLC